MLSREGVIFLTRLVERAYHTADAVVDADAVMSSWRTQRNRFSTVRKVLEKLFVWQNGSSESNAAAKESAQV